MKPCRLKDCKVTSLQSLQRMGIDPGPQSSIVILAESDQPILKWTLTIYNFAINCHWKSYSTSFERLILYILVRSQKIKIIAALLIYLISIWIDPLLLYKCHKKRVFCKALYIISCLHWKLAFTWKSSSSSYLLFVLVSK